MPEIKDPSLLCLARRGVGKNYLPLMGAKTSTVASVEVPLPAGEEQVMVTAFVSPWVIGGVFASEQEILDVALSDII